MVESARRPWRTNVGLRLTKEVGLWFDELCESENRPYANMVEYLIIKEMRSKTDSKVQEDK